MMISKWKHWGLGRSVRKLLCHLLQIWSSQKCSHSGSQCLFPNRKFPCPAQPSLHNHFSIYLEIFLCACQIKCQQASFQAFAYPPLIHPCESRQDISSSNFYEGKKIFSKSLNKTLSKCGSGSFLEITCKVWSKIIAWEHSKLYYVKNSIFITLDYSQKPFH